MTAKRAGQDELFSIANRRTVITGGTAGIGLGVAEHFVSEGADVVITGRRADGAQIADRIGARFIAIDVTDDQSVEQGLAQARRTLGGLDVLVLNAALAAPCGPFDDLDLDVFRRVFDVNLFGALRCLKFGLPHMNEGGVVLVTSSPGGRQAMGLPGLSAYSASKAALDLVTQAAGLELAARGVRVSGILPGYIDDTEIAGGADTSWLAALTATGEGKRSADMAPVYHFLASDAGAMMQGSIVAADDGCTAGLSTPLVMKLLGRQEHVDAGEAS